MYIFRYLLDKCSTLAKPSFSRHKKIYLGDGSIFKEKKKKN